MTDRSPLMSKGRQAIVVFVVATCSGAVLLLIAVALGSLFNRNVWFALALTVMDPATMGKFWLGVAAAIPVFLLKGAVPSAFVGIWLGSRTYFSGRIGYLETMCIGVIVAVATLYIAGAYGVGPLWSIQSKHIPYVVGYAAFLATATAGAVRWLLEATNILPLTSPDVGKS
jgi:hypothetical protein